MNPPQSPTYGISAYHAMGFLGDMKERTSVDVCCIRPGSKPASGKNTAASAAHMHASATPTTVRVHHVFRGHALRRWKILCHAGRVETTHTLFHGLLFAPSSPALSYPHRCSTPCVTFRRVVVSVRGPGQSPVLPFACCICTESKVHAACRHNTSTLEVCPVATRRHGREEADTRGGGGVHDPGAGCANVPRLVPLAPPPPPCPIHG